MAPRQERRTLTAGGQTIAFTALAERFPLTGDDDTELGDAWTFSYLRDECGPARPVLFLFNGGPGCSSAWLHVSGLGPWAAAVPGDLTAAPTAAGALEASTDSILDVADLVFVDPVGTGFARQAPGAAERVTGADRDAALTAQLVLAWILRHRRSAAPVYLLGESYGTIRAALTATALVAAGAPAPAGVAMLGQCLNAQETTQRPGNAAGFVAALPFLAATAWFHGRGAHGADPLETVAARAHAFAVGEYAAALGTEAWSPELVERLAGFTGLSADDLRARRLRVDKEDFRRALLADRGLAVGLTDSRYTVRAPRPAVAEPEVDAASVRIDPVVFAATRELLSDVFGIEDVRPYRFSVAAHEGWDYLEATAVGRFGGSALPSPFAVFDYPAHLSALLRANPDARLFFGTGHFDALTTVGSLEHLLAQYGLPRERIVDRRYPAGHMMYTDRPSRAALAGDLRTFLSA
ncbi:MAG: S10 family serine carboxypeptidase-like protein [Leifsonia sp.]|uniref:S10 family serine carboxypeptidase-like protein n=1 Tax=Leifsonia sp. TaxID=1870902 RepID=UPI003F7F610C